MTLTDVLTVQRSHTTHRKLSPLNRKHLHTFLNISVYPVISVQSTVIKQQIQNNRSCWMFSYWSTNFL